MTQAPSRVLLLGATGRTGSRVLEELTRRRVPVTALVRSAAKIQPGLRASPTVTIVEADLLSLDQTALRRHLEGCGGVVSCLGHPLSLRGIFGQPRNLVRDAVRQVCEAAVALAPAEPIRLVLMSSVSVNRPDRQDTRRGPVERGILAILRALLPPARDNQRAADVLLGGVSQAGAVEWVVVRPDSLIEGEVSEYAVHEGLVDSLFAPGRSRLWNVAHFLCELATNPATFERWKGKMPVLVDVPAPHPVRAPSPAT